MKLVVLGATGATGLEIVRQAIERNHTVTAFVRSMESLKVYRDRIAIIKGDLLRTAELEAAIRGQDAVLSAFGPRVPIAKTDETLLEQFALALTMAMQNSGVRRVVVLSTAFLFRDSAVPYFFGRLFFRNLVADASIMERIVGGKDLDWTIVRPPKLTNKPYTGKYRMLVNHLPRFGFKISRADVADCIIKAAENHASFGEILGVSN